ncbi:MAG: rRNA maturation RNase YbeY [Brevinema sp.]
MISLSFDSIKTVQRPSVDFQKKLEAHIEDILRRFDKNGWECSFLFCNDDFIHNLNLTYRGKDYATDVLSFSQDEGEEMGFESKILGDVIISTDRAVAQAQEFDVSYEEELARLVTHGLLHLLGYDHERGDEDEKEMLALQDELMDKFMLTYSGVKSNHI